MSLTLGELPGLERDLALLELRTWRLLIPVENKVFCSVVCIYVAKKTIRKAFQNF